MDGSFPIEETRAAAAGVAVRAVPHAFPYVAGVSKRVKAEPTHLNRLAATVMAASGTFTGEAAARGGSLAGVIAAIALAAAALGVAAGGAVRPADDNAKPVPAAASVLPDAFYTLGIGDYRDAEASDANDLSHLSSQDRFEIARFHRLYEAARAKREAETSAAKRGGSPAATLRGR